MKAYEKIGINLHQSHCSIVPENTALLFPNLLHFIFPKSLYFFFLFTTRLLDPSSGYVVHFMEISIPPSANPVAYFILVIPVKNVGYDKVKN